MNIRETKKLRTGDKFRRTSKNGHDNGYRVYTVSECSPTYFHAIDQHGYHTEVHFDKSDGKAFMKECSVVTGKEPLAYAERDRQPRMSYEAILNRDVPAIVYNARKWAQGGICASIRIYYKHEAISGMSVAITSDMESGGWKDSGIEIPCNVEYSQYWGFLYRNLGRVPLFA